MPSYRARKILEFRWLRAFFNIEAGITRGAAPDPGREKARPNRRIANLERELEASRERVSQQQSELARLRKSLSEKPSPVGLGDQNGQRAPVFFIVGSGKSGTTWLTRLLNYHPEILSRGEGRFFDREWHVPRLREIEVKVPPRSLYSALYSAEDLRLWTQRSPWSRNEDVEGHIKNLAGLATEYFLQRKLAKSGKKIVGDKTPASNAKVIKEISEVCPQAKVIHVIRDGRDVEVSRTHHRWNKTVDQGGVVNLRDEEAERREAYRNTPEKLKEIGMFDEEDLRKRARAWKNLVKGISNDGPVLMGEHYIEVRYEDMLEDTPAEMRRLLKFLGADTDEEIVRQCVQQSSFENVSGGRQRGEEDSTSALRKGVAGDWKNVFSEKDKQIFKEEAGNVLVDLGYEKDNNW